MSVPHPIYEHFIGVDVGKSALVIHDTRTGCLSEVANELKAVKAFIKTIGPDCLLVCEATGGHEALLLAAALAGGVAAHRADAAKVKAFIRSFGRLGKSDKIDCRGLSDYGKERCAILAPWKKPDEVCQQLQALVQRRADLTAMRAAEKNRAAAPAASPACAKILAASCRAILNALTKQIGALEEKIKALVKQDESLAQSAVTMRNIPGVGFVTAVSLLALMPELGTLPRRKATALAGLAPHPDDSGKRAGHRSVKGGRRQVKAAIFMAAMAAARGPSEMGDYYRRLIQDGKKPMVALTALMRKLIVRINARLRDQTKLQLS